MATSSVQVNVQVREQSQIWKELGRWVFLAPVLILNLVVIVGPAFFGVYIAFTDWSGVGDMNFVGLDNFQRLLADGIFWRALRNNLVWTGIFLVLPVSLGLLGAYMLTGIKRGQMFMRVAFFVPYVLASVVTTQIWRYLLHPRVGLGQWLSDNVASTFSTGLGWVRATRRSTPSPSWTTGTSGVSRWYCCWQRCLRLMSSFMKWRAWMAPRASSSSAT